MKHEALASAVTAIDDDLLQDAITVPPVPRRPAFGRWGAIAAALLLVFGISVLWQQSGTLRLSVGNTIIGSQPCGIGRKIHRSALQGQPVPAITEAVPRTAAEPALYTLGSLEVPLTLSGRGEWQLSTADGELRITQGDAVSAWSGTQQGRGACTVLWAIPQPTAGETYRLTLNAQTMTLSQNEQGVWMIQKAL